METNLYTLFLIPIIGTIGLLFVPKNKKTLSKQIALLTSILTFIESVRLFVYFDSGTAEFQYVTELHWITVGSQPMNLVFGIDGISLFFILLSTFLIPICLLASWDSVKFLEKEYLICFLSLEVLLIGVFTVLDLFGFYILFEGILIPMFIIIGVYGSREQKITAAYYFFFYTLIGSILMLLSIFYIYYTCGTTDYQTLLTFRIDPEVQNILFLAFFASLAVKIPKVPFHIWLPQAHVEAPVAGSVILAGILIKLGAYGFIRFSLPLFPEASVYFTPLVYTLGVIAIIYASFTTLRQTDLKRIIAYSSVSHMGVVTIGIFTLTATGIEGSIFLQIAHGLVSSALFIIVTVLYDRYHTRLVKYYRGVAITMPIYAFLFLFFTLANIAVPLSCNFIGEFLSLLAAFEHNTIIAILACFGMILSASYALFLYNRVCFGSLSPHLLKAPRDLNRREFYVLAPLAFFTIFFGIWPNIILDPIHPSVVLLLQYVHP